MAGWLGFHSQLIQLRSCSARTELISNLAGTRYPEARVTLEDLGLCGLFFILLAGACSKFLREYAQHSSRPMPSPEV